jgi:hypothetical protein
VRRKKELDATISYWRVYNFIICTSLRSNKPLGKKEGKFVMAVLYISQFKLALKEAMEHS